jgi:hypothetical protein
MGIHTGGANPFSVDGNVKGDHGYPFTSFNPADPSVKGVLLKTATIRASITNHNRSSPKQTGAPLT